MRVITATESRARRASPALALVVLAAACATTRGIMALRQVDFRVAGTNDVRLGNVALDRLRSYEDLNVVDAARIASYAVRGQMPLEFALHVTGLNPADNNTTARLVRFTWTLLLNGQETVSGAVDTSYTFPPGVATDVMIPVRLDLVRFFHNNTQDLVELALGLSGMASRPTEITVRASPIIDTPLGPITYPQAITIRRTVGGP
jgi:hypothetical protein